MRFLRQNTATRITVGPFLDKTDGVTPETSLTVTSEKLTLTVDDGGVPTLVLDTAPTASGGSNDMTHITNDDAGFYDLELAAANVNYVGRALLSITDAATHCPVFHEFMILPTNVYDALMGSDKLDVNSAEVGGTAQTGRDLGASVLLSSGTGTGQVSLDSGKVLLQSTQAGVTIPTVTTLTNAPLDSSGITTLLSRLTATRAGYLDQLEHIHDDTDGNNTKLNTIIGYIDTEIAAILAAVDTEVAAIKAKTDNLPASPAAVGSAMTLTAAYDAAKTAATQTSVDVVAGYIDTEVAAIKAKTDTIPANPAAVGSAMTLTATYDAAKTAATQTSVDTIDGIVDTLLTRIIGTIAAGTHYPLTAAQTTYIDQAISAKRAATLAAADVSGNLPSNVLQWNSGALPTIGTSTLTAEQVKTAMEAAGSYLALIKAVTDLFRFTGNDVKATLDGEEVTPTAASKTGYALSTAPPTAADIKSAIEAAGSYLALIKAQTDKLVFEAVTNYLHVLLKAKDNIDFGALEKASLNAVTPSVSVSLTADDIQDIVDGVTAAGIATPEQVAAAVGAYQPAESYAAKGAVPTVAQALLMILQMLSDRGVIGTTATTRKLDGSTTAMTHTLDDAVNPTDIKRAS